MVFKEAFHLLSCNVNCKLKIEAENKYVHKVVVIWSHFIGGLDCSAYWGFWHNSNEQFLLQLARLKANNKD